MQTEKETLTNKSSFSVMGMVQAKDEDKNVTRIFKEEFLEKEPGKRATKLRRTYEKAELTKNGNKVEPSFIGKAVLIERDGKVWKYSIDGKDFLIDYADADFLNDEFSEKKKSEDETKLEDLMMPKEAVAVNETWKIDVAGVAKEFGKDNPFTVDVAKSTGSGKLLKAYKKDGKQYGAIEFNVELALTKIGAGAMTIDLDNTSKMKMTIKFDGCIDGAVHTGTMDMAMDMKIAGTLKMGNVEVKIDSGIKATGVQTAEELTGKK